MTIFRKSLVTIFVVSSLSLVSVFALTQIETTNIFYDSYKEMKRNGALQSGWIPVWLPGSAKNIHESHDIDTNESWLTFTFSDTEKFYLLACNPIKKEETELPRKKTFTLLPSFVRDMHTDLANSTDLLFFRCEQNSPGYLAVNGHDNIAYFWQLSH